jgi:hypothetical protein
VEHRDGVRAAQHHHRTPLVGATEPVRPHLAARYSTGHAPSSVQPAYSSPMPPSRA